MKELGLAKLGPSPDTHVPDRQHPGGLPRSRKWKLILLSLLIVALVLASVISAILLVGLRTRASGAPLGRRPTQAISRTCAKARYPDLCVDSLLDFPGSMAASEQDLVHISFNMTLQHFDKALYRSSGMDYLQMEPIARSAYDDCMELLDDSVDALSRSLSAVGGSGSPAAAEDVVTWLSAALTNQDTCGEGLADARGGVKDRMAEVLKDLEELVSNCLAIFAATDGGGDFAGVPIQNRRRLMDAGGGASKDGTVDGEYPEWLGERERELLDMPAAEIQADIVVAKDGGNGSCKTIAEAIKKAPENSNRRTIIYVRAGRYEEDNLKVGRKKRNLMFIGDGKGKTVVTGGKSVADKTTTFHTASFAASGAGFIARDMSFENSAGPAKHQAVALRVGADHGVVYRCSISGYQDTLYVHSNRQFFRECDIYGTVDFIFGNAAVVIQKCNIYARKPMAKQKNTITAQNRKDPNQNTGISIHASQIVATSDLEASKGSFPTYLGRPWKMYSRVVYLLSYMGDHIHPQGWLEWNGDFALDTLYYGEYMNDGPGAGVGQRVKWPGYRVITSTTEASKFTVAQFIFGSSWLPSTGVAFVAGLST
ncbi:probable pectinesterase/pectinesterase inhibitor 34 isoform X1 [Rhodamnia argentea]|uniref:Pectinesterase n=2 Tax=Rhodamnia argentea TaxID=178133 RepID=A0A8B8QPJ9_9MYRT|nr:probable pectinesterase/pectinesterase inhibitor 34 isoform X1 [Rhodamnia argentea]